MQYKTNQSFSKVLSEDPTLSKLLTKLENLEEINQLIASKLDSSLLNNCKVSNLRDGTLILSTNSPVWNHKLRFQSLDLLSALRADPRWSGLKAIEIRVDYIPQLEHSTSTDLFKPKPLSAASAKTISELADSVAFKPLAAVLKRLSKQMPPSTDVDTL